MPGHPRLLSQPFKKDVDARHRRQVYAVCAGLTAVARDQRGTAFMTSPGSRTPPSRVNIASIVSSLLTVETSGPGFVDLTREIAAFVKETDAVEG